MPSDRDAATPGATPGASSETASRQVRSAVEERFDQIIFLRDLYEVHLLIDFISGRTDKTLDDLEVSDTTDEKLKGIKVIQKITSMRYPPDPPPAKSGNAAFLLAAKNNLTMLAQPARGLTIAFTAMFVGLGYEAARASPQSFAYRASRMVLGPLDGLMARLTPAVVKVPPHDPDDALESLTSSRAGLARIAFPGLVRPVRSLRVTLRFLMFFFFLFWLPLTAITYWDVSFLKSTLQPLEQAAKDRVTLALVSPAFDHNDCPPAVTNPPIRDARSAACQRIQDIMTREFHARTEVANFLDCQGFFSCKLFHAIRWRFVLFNYDLPPSMSPADPVGREYYAASLLSVFANYVLPMMFGFLGAGVRMLRVIQYKLRDSLLGPRDLLLTLIGLLIGAIAGVAVGLFLAPSDVSLGSVAGNLTLTASGLGFLAGYGSDHFLAMLDNLLDRIFVSEQAPEASAATATKGAADAKAIADAKADADARPAGGNVKPPGG